MPSELWQDPSSMIWYLRSSTSSNDLSFPTAPVTVAGDESTKTITLTNSGTTPASVELSFDQPYLKGVDPDHGDPTTPSYVVDPDASPRIITVERDSAPPVDPSLVNITLTGNAGLIASIPVSVAFLIDFATEVRTIATPGLEWLFAGNFNSTGSIAGATLASVGSLVATASGEEASLTGYADATAAGMTAKATIPQVDFLRNRDRSWIYVWKNVSAVTGTYHLAGYGGGTENGLGWVTAAGGYFKSSYNGGAAFDFTTADGTHSDPSGTATTLSTAIDKTSLLIASYNLSANEMTWRWKQSGDAAGHTYKTQTSTLETGTSTGIMLYPISWSALSTEDIRWRYAGVIDAGISAAQFDDFANVLGL